MRTAILSLAAFAGLALTAGTADARPHLFRGAYSRPYYGGYSSYQPYYGGYYSRPYYSGYSSYRPYSGGYYGGYGYRPGFSFSLGIGSGGFYPYGGGFGRGFYGPGYGGWRW